MSVAVSIFVSDGKVACLKTECPAVDTVCDGGMNAIAVPGTEGDCCQKYICGMYTHRLYLFVPKQVFKVYEAPWSVQLWFK
jgi:hypothetical protein